jgi:hypothetical protein
MAADIPARSYCWPLSTFHRYGSDGVRRASDVWLARAARRERVGVELLTGDGRASAVAHACHTCSWCVFKPRDGFVLSTFKSRDRQRVTTGKSSLDDGRQQ